MVPRRMCFDGKLDWFWADKLCNMSITALKLSVRLCPLTVFLNNAVQLLSLADTFPNSHGVLDRLLYPSDPVDGKILVS